MVEKLLLKPNEAADAIGVGRSKIYQLLAAGTIPSIRINSSLRVPVDGLKKWIAETARGGVTAA
jgi:prophage regulatory protein